ncbi:MAG: bifunctional diaminohydroxyphosphoribosylaminopyrimidine deaminase/5-amino-6-(5-phosphoribosylamino)uracil reductase RibD [Burkholderiales bacterium]|jgi:diaminohydroxyphosphoribosylaminopyrimidine deaminase/5-amino-6-(5-phosphoribosylamino)uracil reductase|nr:bifunctional diaminohydroxyphosphoribosylaminopyrimidine deaminase/5-amino-6-(5-phosphoribosylamino)uracil reductase RibD [Burkholderiales bacterium]
MWNDADTSYMRRALQLAALGLYTTTPNPRVGCVIVKENHIIGEGWHRKSGEPHAEPLALADAHNRGFNPRGATMYVSLEPCRHHGRMPPCTQAIIESGVRRVVAACADPNPLAARGGKILQDAGISFELGLLEQDARELNRGFISRMRRNRPWVRSKIAASIDGRIALRDGRSQWITGESARADGHRDRASSCAILTGVGTVVTDDPSLTVRAVETSRQPLRIVLDSQAQTPLHSRLMQDGGDTLIVTAQSRPQNWNSHIHYLHLPAHGKNGHYATNDLNALMSLFAQREINELHVEAGGRLNGALLEAGLLDEMICYLSPRILGQNARAMFETDRALTSLDDFADFSFFRTCNIGDDLRIELRHKKTVEENKCSQVSSPPSARYAH